jgi:hypothetical protein
MWLLEWLLNRARTVIDWFGDSYYYARNLIYSIPQTIDNVYKYIVVTYNNLVSYISNSLIYFYNANIKPVFTDLYNLWVQIKSRLENLYNQFIAFVNDILSRLYKLWVDILQYVRDRYDSFIDNLRIKIDYVYSRLIPDIISKIDAILPFRSWLESITPLLSLDTLKNILKHYQTTANMVTTVVSNPLGFILGLLWQEGIKFFSYFLAYSLGTVKYNLPAPPNWGGGAVIPSREHIPVDGIIGKPLKSLYISGYTYSDTHHGVDFGAADNENVYAVSDGVVEYAGWSTVGYGFYIDLSGDKIWSRYAHLKNFAVSQGQRVTAGQVIGYADSTGNSTGTHLHFELKINGVYVNPLDYIS